MHGRALLAGASVGLMAAASLVACQEPVACPAIAAAPFLTIHVAAGLAAKLDPTSVTATACQDSGCHDGPLALADEQPTGSSTAGQAGSGKVGRIDMGVLTETPIDLAVSGQDLLGTVLGPYRVQFAPRISYPWGYSCPRVITADATWDSAGLRQSEH